MKKGPRKVFGLLQFRDNITAIDRRPFEKILFGKIIVIASLTCVYEAYIDSDRIFVGLEYCPPSSISLQSLCASPIQTNLRIHQLDVYDCAVKVWNHSLPYFWSYSPSCCFLRGNGDILKKCTHIHIQKYIRCPHFPAKNINSVHNSKTKIAIAFKF